MRRDLFGRLLASRSRQESLDLGHASARDPVAVSREEHKRKDGRRGYVCQCAECQRHQPPRMDPRNGDLFG